MKLKQRAVVTSSLFLVMTTLFLVGVLLVSRPEDAENSVVNSVGKNGKLKQRVKTPDIPGVPDYIVDERVNNPNNQDRQAVADALVARYNRSRGLPDLRRNRNRLGKPDMLERGRDKNRHLQQKNPKSTHEVSRDPKLLGMLAQRNSLLKDQLPQVNGAQIKDDQLSKLKIEHVKAEADENPLRVGKRDPWKMWHSWVKQDQFYPEDAFWSEEMNSILHAMATYPITSFDVGHKGTQLKVSMFLDEQRTAFKPMR